MSAFLTSDKNKNIIVAYIKRTSDLQYLNLKEIDQSSASDYLLNKLHQLNHAALVERYGDDAPDMFEYNINTPPQYISGMSASKIETYKALQCFLYQCMEGEVVKNPLYKELEEVGKQLAESIVMDLPEYQAADWDN